MWVFFSTTVFDQKDSEMVLKKIILSLKKKSFAMIIFFLESNDNILVITLQKKILEK